QGGDRPRYLVEERAPEIIFFLATLEGFRDLGVAFIPGKKRLELLEKRQAGGAKVILSRLRPRDSISLGDQFSREIGESPHRIDQGAVEIEDANLFLGMAV